MVINHTKGVVFWINPLKNRINQDTIKVVEMYVTMLTYFVNFFLVYAITLSR